MIALVLSVGGVVFCLVVKSSTVRYGFVNTEKLLTSFVGAQRVEGELRKEKDKWDSARRTMADSLAAFESRMELVYDSASLETKKRLKSEQVHRIEELGRFTKAEENGLIKMRSELMEPVYKQINSALAEFSRERGLDVVFASSNGSIVYGEGSRADITDDFVSFLNKRYH